MRFGIVEEMPIRYTNKIMSSVEMFQCNYNLPMTHFNNLSRNFAASATRTKVRPRVVKIDYTFPLSQLAISNFQKGIPTSNNGHGHLDLYKQGVQPGNNDVASNNKRDVMEKQIFNGFKQMPSVQHEFFLPFRFRLPEKVSNYKFGKVVGTGFFAKVYEAEDLSSTGNKKVAIKCVSKTKCPKEVFTRELDMMKYIQTFATKENSLGVIKDVFETPESVCFVLELCNGGDMFDYVLNHGKLNESEARSVMKNLLTALNTLHSHDILHRDVKLENILLVEPDDVSKIQLADFGYAKFDGESDIFKNPAGTFGYVAPEVLKSRLYSDKCDVWSAGIVLYTLLSAQQPFPYKANAYKEKQFPGNNCATEAKNDSGTGRVNTKNNHDLVNAELEAILHGREASAWEFEMTRGSFRHLSDDVKDLLNKLLDTNPNQRISASEALKHSWFSNREAAAQDVAEEVEEARSSDGSRI